MSSLAGTPHPPSRVLYLTPPSDSPSLFTAPTNPRHVHEQQSQSTWTASARAYSAALITAMREECERERRAHSESLRRIAELEAQLARREAELEERFHDLTSINVSLEDPPLPQLSRDGAIRILQHSAARNEALTHEIAGLVQKVILASNFFPGPLRAMKLNPIPGSFTARRCTSGAGAGKYFTFLIRNDDTFNTTKNSTQSSTIPGIADTPTPSFINTPTFLQELISYFTRAPFIFISLSACIAIASRVAPNRHSAADSSGNSGPRWPTCRRAACASCASAAATRGTSYHDYDHAALGIPEAFIDSLRCQDAPPPISNHSPTGTSSKQTFRRVLLIEEECIRCGFTSSM